MSDKLQEINRENVLEKMHNYLHVWDLVGVINQSITDAEDRNALLDVLEGAQLIIEQLEQARNENHVLSAQLLIAKTHLEQAQAANQKLVDCLQEWATILADIGQQARTLLAELKQ